MPTDQEPNLRPFASLAKVAGTGQSMVMERLATTAAVMLAGIALPFTPFAAAIHLQPRPWGFFIYLALVLPAYSLLTQRVKVHYIHRFGSWL